MNTNKTPDKPRRAGFRRIVALLVIVVVICLICDSQSHLFYGQVVAPKNHRNNDLSEDANLVADESSNIIDKNLPPNMLVHLSLPYLNIDKAPIVTVFKNPHTNVMGSPNSMYEVGWFNESGLPGGKNNQTIILDGHSGAPNQQAIFKKLIDVPLDSLIELSLADGSKRNYSIKENYSIALEKLTVEKMQEVIQPIPGQETVLIFSCSGNWYPDQQTFDHRVIVKAILQK